MGPSLLSSSKFNLFFIIIFSGWNTSFCIHYATWSPFILTTFLFNFLNYLFNNAYWHWYYYFHCLLIILIITSTSLYVFNDMYARIKGSKSVIYWFTEVMVLIIFGIFLLNPCRFDTRFFLDKCHPVIETKTVHCWKNKYFEFIHSNEKDNLLSYYFTFCYDMNFRVRSHAIKWDNGLLCHVVCCTCKSLFLFLFLFLNS